MKSAKEGTPHDLAERSERWLASNEKAADQVRWGRFPLGMVQRWIERAEDAEALVLDQARVIEAILSETNFPRDEPIATWVRAVSRIQNLALAAGGETETPAERWPCGCPYGVAHGPGWADCPERIR